MLIGRIEGATRVLGKSQGYIGLPIKDTVINCANHGPDTPVMITAWFPTPAELVALAAGAPIHVTILGRAHPPMMLSTGKIPE